MNPFKYGQVVSAKDFCPRPELLEQLKGFVDSGQNVVLQGERRIGKTSLIYETVRKLKRHRMLYVDLLEIKSTDDLCKRMVTAIIAQERLTGFLEKVLQALSQLRPVLSLDPVTGQPTISLDAGVKLRPDSIAGLLDLITDMQKRRPLVVVFDEFQDILNLPESAETLASLRSKIQFHAAIPYLFAGSIRNQMNDIFNDPRSAFYKSAATLDVGPLEDDVFVRFLSGRFVSGKRSIANDVLLMAFEIADRVPGDVQELCSCLWDTTSPGDQITKKNIGPALELIYARELKGYEAVLVRLTGQQLKCLTGLARMGGKTPLSAAFLKGVGIALPASVKKALSRLMQLKVIYRYEGEYRFVNPFFRSWLIWKSY